MLPLIGAVKTTSLLVVFILHKKFIFQKNFKQIGCYFHISIVYEVKGQKGFGFPQVNQIFVSVYTLAVLAIL